MTLDYAIGKRKATARRNRPGTTRRNNPQVHIGPVPRRQDRHRRPGSGPARHLAADAPHRPGRRPQVQGRPLVPAQTTQEPHRRAISDAAPAPPPRRGPLARLHPHRGLPRDLRRRPRTPPGRTPHRWCSTASRSRLAPFVKVAKTIRNFRDGILAALRLKINNGRAEGLNNHVRLITRRAYGFHSAKAALALIMLSCGPIELQLPHERSPG